MPLNKEEKLAFERICEIKPDLTAELLAKYLHQMNSSKFTSVTIKAAIDQGTEMFRCIKSLDIFEEFYRQELSRRILSNESRDTHIEELIINKISSE